MKELFFSDILNRTFDSKEKCLAEEAKYVQAKKEKEEKERKASESRKADSEKVKAAFELYKKNYNEYLSLRNEFIKKYGSYHMSFTDIEEMPLMIDVFKLIDCL